MINVQKVKRTPDAMDALEAPQVMTLLEFHAWYNKLLRETGFYGEDGGGVDGGCFIYGADNQVEYVVTIKRDDFQ